MERHTPLRENPAELLRSLVYIGAAAVLLSIVGSPAGARDRGEPAGRTHATTGPDMPMMGAASVDIRTHVPSRGGACR